MSVEEAAAGILTVVNAVMVKAIRKLSVERGLHPKEFALAAFGGGGPLHAADLATELEISTILIPATPGVSSALGLLTADFRLDFVRTVLWRLTPDKLEALKQALEELARQALDQMNESLSGAPIQLRATFDARYFGQGFSLAVQADVEEVRRWNDLSTLTQRFHEAHALAYGHSNPSGEVELVNVRLASIGTFPHAPLTRAPKDASEGPGSVRSVYFEGAYRETPVFARESLPQGVDLVGPALVEQVDSTVIVFPGHTARVDESGNLVIRTEGEK